MSSDESPDCKRQRLDVPTDIKINACSIERVLMNVLPRFVDGDKINEALLALNDEFHCNICQIGKRKGIIAQHCAAMKSWKPRKPSITLFLLPSLQSGTRRESFIAHHKDRAKYCSRRVFTHVNLNDLKHTCRDELTAAQMSDDAKLHLVVSRAASAPEPPALRRAEAGRRRAREPSGRWSGR